MQFDIIKKIIKLLDDNNLKKIHLKDGDFEISLEKNFSEKEEAFIPEPKKDVNLEVKNESKKPKKTLEEKNCITSPMVGTFYITPSPEQPPFVKVGDKVEENTIVCILEAMKVMNELKAGKKGIIKQILVENASFVEFGQKLFEIE